MNIVFIFIAILIFGILIAIHELGHFISAKTLGVRVNQFAIGMGPAIFKMRRGETEYSLRLLPIGGFCEMEGEDEESGDERSFGRQPIWKRFIILVAGSFMNFLLGFIIILLLMLPVKEYYSTTIEALLPGFPYESENGFLPGDRILSINGDNIYIHSDLNVFLSRGETGEAYDFVVLRDGEKHRIDNLPLERGDYQYINPETGETETRRLFGFTFAIQSSSIPVNLQNTWYNCVDFVRLVRLGLVDLVTGRATAADVSGFIGIVGTIAEVGVKAVSVVDALVNIAYLAGFIAINLAVMNLLPLPALDGGRILFLLVELVRRKPINPRYEGYVHLAGFAFFMLLMVVVAYNDIVKLVL